MATVYKRKNESLDDTIARFSKATEKDIAVCRQQMAFRSKHDIERDREKVRDKKRRQRGK